MKKLFVIAFAVFAMAIVMPQDASAASYYYGNTSYSNSQVSTRIEALLREVARLQAELARIRGMNTGGQCYTYGNAEYCYNNDIHHGTGGTGDIRTIDVDYRNSAAYVTVEFRTGREREYIVGGADSNSEVIDAMARTLNLSHSQVAALISFDDDDYDDDDDDNDDNDDEDIDYIRVTIDRDDDEAEARVRYDDGDTDTFSYDTDVKSEIIEELSDDLDIDEDDVEDLVDWDYDDSNDDDNNDDDIEDIDSIDATINEDDERTNVRVEWDNGSVSHYTYNTDDEDEVIEELSDDLDIDEDDIEDIIDFDYVD